MSDTNAKTKAPRERSPSYPAISLKAAFERLQQFSAKFGRHPAPYKKSGLAWGMKEGSSQANRVLAALKAFGLIEYKGSGDNRIVALSDDGRNFLRAQQESVKSDIIRHAALRPKSIAQFWPIWRDDRPLDEICLDDLIMKHGFNDQAAPEFLKVYDDTIAYAGLSDSDKINDDEDDERGSGDDEDVGDDETGHSPPPPHKYKVMMMHGERELTTGMLAKDANFRLIVSGKIGAKEIDRLIAKLELDKEILAEPDDDEDEAAE